MFSKGELVAYPAEGVGRIVEIRNDSYFGKTEPYYIIRVQNSMVKVPVSTARKKGLRRIASSEEAVGILKSIGSQKVNTNGCWAHISRRHVEFQRSGRLTDAAASFEELIMLRKSNRVKIVGSQFRSLFNKARTLLVHELSFAIGVKPAEMEAILYRKLGYSD